MPFIAYKSIRFSRKSKATIEQANTIIREYQKAGFELTLRQLYYQFVSRGLIANTQKSYKALGDVINDARLAGLIDWNAIVDRTRNLRGLSTWDSPQDIIASAAGSFRIDKWADQDHHVEVWIEKDALIGVIEGVCNDNQVSFFSCRGYTSQSEMWAAGRRLAQYESPVVIHLGDHDPSGLDMSRDIEERLNLFMEDAPLTFRRIALNMDQITKYNPPPNPAKITDSRAEAYIARYGTESWELDALEPQVIANLIQSEINNWLDADMWDAELAREGQLRGQLTACKQRWSDVVEFLGEDE